MMLHPNTISSAMADPGRTRHSKRKAAAETPEGNERLSKRLSLLNLDNSGIKAYVAVPESQSALSVPLSHAPTAAATAALPVVLEESRQHAPAVPHVSPVDPVVADAPYSSESSRFSRNGHGRHTAVPPVRRGGGGDDDGMSLDDSKYKVYIHSIDAELADDEAEDADDEANGANGATETTYEAVQARDGSGRLVFMPVVDKHLRAAARDAVWGASLNAQSSPARHKLAIPRPIIPNKDGEIAGMQVVLYRDPTSLTVPPENDSVRQAILDTRARYRERRREQEQQGRPKDELEVIDVTDGDDEDGGNSVNGVNDVNGVTAGTDNDDTSMTSTPVPGTPVASAEDGGLDSDGMDLD